MLPPPTDGTLPRILYEASMRTETLLKTGGGIKEVTWVGGTRGGKGMASNSEVSGTSISSWAMTSDKISPLATSTGAGAGSDDTCTGQGSGLAICPWEGYWATGSSAVTGSDGQDGLNCSLQLRLGTKGWD